MRIFLFTLGLGLALALGTFRAAAQDPDYGQGNIDDQTGATANALPGETASTPTGSISFQQFYTALGQYGTWINTDKYGYVFQPTETDPNWAPYTNGQWVHSDAGLTWAGNDSFSWATDHYGRWVNLEGTGWVWVPGYTWGPGWVSWRQSDDGNDVGWAPLPPDSDVGIDYYGDNDQDDYGYHIGDDADLVYGIGPWWYTWLPVVWFGNRDCFHHYYHRGDNFARMGHSHNVTNINFTRGGGAGRFGRVHAAGPSIASLNARSRTPVPNVQLARASTLDNAGLRGNGTLGVFAPSVDPSTRATSRPDGVSGIAERAQINRGLDVNHGLAVNSRVAGPTATWVKSRRPTRSARTSPAPAWRLAADTSRAASTARSMPCGPRRARRRSSAPTRCRRGFVPARRASRVVRASATRSRGMSSRPRRGACLILPQMGNFAPSPPRRSPRTTPTCPPRTPSAHRALAAGARISAVGDLAAAATSVVAALAGAAATSAAGALAVAATQVVVAEVAIAKCEGTIQKSPDGNVVRGFAFLDPGHGRRRRTQSTDFAIEFAGRTPRHAMLG